MGVEAVDAPARANILYADVAPSVSKAVDAQPYKDSSVSMRVPDSV